MASMDLDGYFRHEAAMYRQLAGQTDNVCGKPGLGSHLRGGCDSIEDRLTGG
jgi:hypothetical protein